jgi:hypothetical protein
VALLQLAIFPVLVTAVVGELRPYLGLVERASFAVPSIWQAAVAVVGVRMLDAAPVRGLTRPDPDAAGSWRGGDAAPPRQTHQWPVPGPPLNGPTTRLVTQPP